MLITLEHLEAMIRNYSKGRSNDEILGFIDGMNAMLDYVEYLNKKK